MRRHLDEILMRYDPTLLQNRRECPEEGQSLLAK